LKPRQPPRNFKGGAKLPEPDPVHYSSLELPRGDLWVFTYGSLMWDPGFAHIAAEPALLRGYHRAFCIYSSRYRGTVKAPGLVLGLDPGGACNQQSGAHPRLVIGIHALVHETLAIGDELHHQRDRLVCFGGR
jgi:hypothetical protein